MSLKVTVLGSGTSTGVPVIGCRCATCTSSDLRNRRLRPGLKIEIGGGTLLVDSPTDLRQQALRFGLERVDAVLFTHAHADHIFGLDDLRVFNFRQRRALPCYGSAETLAVLRRVFFYAFEPSQEGGGKPKLELEPVDGPFELLGATIVPIPVLHGELTVYGYRIGGFAYVTDCNRIPEASRRALAGLDVLILDALRYRSHPTHFTLDEALAVVRDLAPRRTYLTHLAHEIEHGAVDLPPAVELAYDGLEIVLPPGA